MSYEVYLDYEGDSLKPCEAAKFIGCSVYTIKEMARNKKIPHYRVGARILFRKSSLKNWIEKQERENWGT